MATVRSLRKRWRAKQYISAAMLGTLFAVALVAATSISLAPARMSFSVVKAEIGTYNKPLTGPVTNTHLNFDLVANNTSQRTAVWFDSVSAEIWYGPAATAWVRTKDAGLPAGWQPPRSVISINVSADYGATRAATNPRGLYPPPPPSFSLLPSSVHPREKPPWSLRLRGLFHAVVGDGTDLAAPQPFLESQARPTTWTPAEEKQRRRSSAFTRRTAMSLDTSSMLRPKAPAHANTDRIGGPLGPTATGDGDWSVGGARDKANLRGNEAPLVATSVVMFVLAVLFFILNLFSRSSDMSTNLNPTVRLFLSTSLSLFLPAMSYLFSEAKNAVGQTADLSVRARTILMWMFLVELLRKKVEAILVTAGMQGYSDTIHSASRVVWLGSLVFFNLRSAGKKALYGTLWVLAAAKLVQRFVTVELGKRSFAYGKNPQLIASYMTQMLKLQGQAGSDVLKRCNYVVIGEEELKKKAGPKGYKLEELGKAISEADSSVVTVGKIWALAEKDPMLRKDPKLKRICLSFALFKMLRRRLEEFPITDAEASNCRDLILKGLRREGMGGEDAIQLFSDELQFLCEYYHSVLPVVFASPFFFVHNYILFPIIVWALCILMLILCSNGDVAYAWHSFRNDNYVMSGSVLRMAKCVLGKVWESLSTPFVFCSIDISITILLILAFAYEEVWEFILFLLSNWFMVSLLCSHTSMPEWRTHPLLSRIIPCIVTARCPWQSGTQPEDGREAATALSGYCAYLVAFHPELLPDDKDGTELVYTDMKNKLKEEMGGWWAYYWSGEGDRCSKLMEVAGRRHEEETTVISKGARLGKVLIDRYKEGERQSVWKLLGDLWTEVVLHVAPTSSELHMKAHKEALAEGGEFITVLWAIVTHTGITRPPEPAEAPLRTISIAG
ncbi:hypothetical protein TRIUR3_11897 [Triticum urartu]|uniref:DUF4220 domain-containing protein n=1 Tax=Triticum urartu TaxID=4572 RepID=M8AJE7_TRIUA|nr:hypothetical protein TRIUR3_11897 [Triticum urartu]